MKTVIVGKASAATTTGEVTIESPIQAPITTTTTMAAIQYCLGLLSFYEVSQTFLNPLILTLI